MSLPLGFNAACLVDLVRGAEAVEEVHDGHAARQRGQVRHQRQVLRLLHAVAAQHGPPRLAHSHHVLRGRAGREGWRLGGMASWCWRRAGAHASEEPRSRPALACTAEEASSALQRRQAEEAGGARAALARLMVAKDGQRVSRKRAGRHMQHARHQLARDLVPAPARRSQGRAVRAGREGKGRAAGRASGATMTSLPATTTHRESPTGGTPLHGAWVGGRPPSRLLR